MRSASKRLGFMSPVVALAVVGVLGCGNEEGTGGGGSGSTSTSVGSSTASGSTPCVITLTGAVNETISCTAVGLATDEPGFASSFLIEAATGPKDAQVLIAPTGNVLSAGTYDHTNISQTVIRLDDGAYKADGTDPATSTQLVVTSSVDTGTKDGNHYEQYVIHGSGKSTLTATSGTATVTMTLSF